MDRLISEFEVIRAIEKFADNIFTKNTCALIKDIKAIPSAEYETEITKYSDDEKCKALITLYFDSINCKDKEKRKRYNTAIKLIESIPSAEPKWIPMREKMPEEKQDVLACFYNGDGDYKLMVSCRIDYNYWIGVGRTGDIVAWMPLPEPKIGHWFDCGSLSCRCDQCGCKNNKESNLCPSCGAIMVGNDESQNQN